MPVLRLLLDHNVPNSVAAVFKEYGHEVHLLRDVLLPDTPDPIVAAVSEENVTSPRPSISSIWRDSRPLSRRLA